MIARYLSIGVPVSIPARVPARVPARFRRNQMSQIVRGRSRQRGKVRELRRRSGTTPDSQTPTDVHNYK